MGRIIYLIPETLACKGKRTFKLLTQACGKGSKISIEDLSFKNLQSDNKEERAPSNRAWSIGSEHAVKEGIAFILGLAITGQLLASDKIRITVNNYTAESGEFVIHAAAAGKPIDLLCDQDSPFCSVLMRGEYWMVDWTVPTIEYRGDYVCKDVDLYRTTANPERYPKVGEYCLVEKDSR